MNLRYRKTDLRYLKMNLRHLKVNSRYLKIDYYTLELGIAIEWLTAEIQISKIIKRGNIVCIYSK